MSIQYELCEYKSCCLCALKSVNEMCSWGSSTKICEYISLTERGRSVATPLNRLLVGARTSRPRGVWQLVREWETREPLHHAVDAGCGHTGARVRPHEILLREHDSSGARRPRGTHRRATVAEPTGGVTCRVIQLNVLLGFFTKGSSVSG